MSEWGSIEGDLNANTIFADRRRDGVVLTNTVGVFFLALIGLGIWYAVSGSRIALALEIGVAAICAAGWARKEQHRIQTYVMVAEQRARNIEEIVSRLGDRS